MVPAPFDKKTEKKILVTPWNSSCYIVWKLYSKKGHAINDQIMWGRYAVVTIEYF